MASNNNQTAFIPIPDYKGFQIKNQNGIFVFEHGYKHDGTNCWCGWSFNLEDAKEQIDDMVDDFEAENIQSKNNS